MSTYGVRVTSGTAPSAKVGVRLSLPRSLGIHTVVLVLAVVAPVSSIKSGAHATSWSLSSAPGVGVGALVGPGVDASTRGGTVMAAPGTIGVSVV